MTNTVIIDGQRVSAFDAIVWAQEEFGMDSFELKNQFPLWHWRFEFKDPKQATYFALKWL